MFEFLLGPPGSLPNSNVVRRERPLTYDISGDLTNVAEVLCEESHVDEILWNFSRLPVGERITLRKNPHFYRDLSSSAPKYSSNFTADPMLKFCFSDETGIRVLTDERSRVFLETGKKRVFGNFWVPDKAIIFKGPGVVHLYRFSILTRSDNLPDVCGKLEGEGVVAKDIEGTPNLWREAPPLAGEPTTDSANPNDPKKDMVFEDWRQLVRDALYSRTSIRISTKDTLPEDQDKSWVSCISTRPAFVLTRAEVLSSPTNPTRPLRARSSTVKTRSSGASSGVTAPHRRQTAPPVMQHSSALQPSPSSRGPSAVASPSPERPTSITQNQNPPVAVPSLAAGATPAHPQARPLPSATPQSMVPPPRQAAPTGKALIRPGELTATALSQPQTAQPVIPYASAPQPALSTGGPSTVESPSPARPTSISQNQNPPVAAPPSMTVASPTQHQVIPATPQRLDPPPRQAPPTGAVPIPPTDPAPEKKKNWFQRKIWDYKGK